MSSAIVENLVGRDLCTPVLGCIPCNTNTRLLTASFVSVSPSVVLAGCVAHLRVHCVVSDSSILVGLND
jgi:hypothetical protein